MRTTSTADLERPSPPVEKHSSLLERLSRTSATDRELRRGKASRGIQVVVAIALALICWTIVARIVSAPALFPSVLLTVERFWRLFLQGEIAMALVVSSVRILVGFAIGSAVGIVVGFLTGASRIGAAVLDPFLHFFRFIPPIVWFGPALLLFGLGETSKVILIVYTTFFVVAINTHAGVRQVAKDAVRMSRTFGAGRLAVFWRVVLPASAGHIFVGMRVAMGSSFMTVVVAEMLGANQGIGQLIASGANSADTSLVFVGVVMLGFAGLVADQCFVYLMGRFGAHYMTAI